MDEFKKEFKYYKSRAPPPSLSNVIYFHEREDKNCLEPLEADYKERYGDINKTWGLKPLGQWKIFTLPEKNGLIFIKNPFYGIGQRYWIARCLKDYTKKPNKLNLDAHHQYLEDGKPWWEESLVHIDLKKKLRWATLGYHHDWDTKVYNEEDVTPFPEDLEQLCKYIGHVVGFPQYLPQASIVNYYHMDSTLAPHTDHSEKYLDAPLISISFGQSAIFLIGGHTKDVKPVAVWLQSGDIVIMSKECRLSYHAVPRIVTATDTPWNVLEDCHPLAHFDHLLDPALWKPYQDYVTDSRININVRQVTTCL